LRGAWVVRWEAKQWDFACPSLAYNWYLLFQCRTKRAKPSPPDPIVEGKPAFRTTLASWATWTNTRGPSSNMRWPARDCQIPRGMGRQRVLIGSLMTTGAIRFTLPPSRILEVVERLVWTDQYDNALRSTDDNLRLHSLAALGCHAQCVPAPGAGAHRGPALGRQDSSLCCRRRSSGRCLSNPSWVAPRGPCGNG
jgi:hypothetical protein